MQSTILLGSLPLRGQDKWGDGAYGSSRGGGSRKHKGIDIAAYPGTVIRTATVGIVTKIGYPYKNDFSFRYVQVSHSNKDYRYFYVLPLPEIVVGSKVLLGQPIGTVQDLTLKYPGMTNHVHFGIKFKLNGLYIDPTPFILDGDEVLA